MKVLCKIRAYYNGEIIKPGTVVDYKGDTVPVWGKAVGTKNNKQDTNPSANNTPTQQKIVDADNKTDGEDTNKSNGSEEQKDNTEVKQINPVTAQELANKTETELEAILDDLRTQALEKNIIVDADNKTVIEQINELKIKLDEENQN